MKARCISYTGDRATVIIMPSWLGRLWGRCAVCVELEFVVRASCDGFRDWRTVATGRWLDSGLPHAAGIRDALDFREVGSEPRRARALIGGTVAP